MGAAAKSKSRPPSDAPVAVIDDQRRAALVAAAAESYLRARGIPAGQLGAQGAGYLSPVASNLTPEGREENRRIEAILLPPE